MYYEKDIMTGKCIKVKEEQLKDRKKRVQSWEHECERVELDGNVEESHFTQLGSLIPYH